MRRFISVLAVMAMMAAVMAVMAMPAFATHGGDEQRVEDILDAGQSGLEEAEQRVPPGEHPLRMRATSPGSTGPASEYIPPIPPASMEIPFLVPDEPRFLLPDEDLPGA